MPVALSRKDLLLLVVLTVLWGVNWPVMKAGVRDFAPITFRVLCMAGGVVLLALVARAQGHSLRVRREHWPELVLLGLTNVVIWYVLAIWGVKLLSSGRAAILGYTMPVWTALFGWLLYRDRLDARMGLGVLAAFGAVALLLGSELATLTGRPLGTLFMLGAAAAWGLGTQLMRRRRLTEPVVVLTFWMLLMALVTSGAIAWLTERQMWVRWPDTVEWWAIVYNVFMVFGVSQLLWFRLATILPPVASSLSVMLIPVVGLFSGMALLGERPTWHDWLALACVLVAIASVLLPARRPAA
ncbi:MAG: DMT family transporter [Burkholderiales bacterium]|nr:MAG: DMT family transporter [Burkholderiales bacterium]